MRTRIAYVIAAAAAAILLAACASPPRPSAEAAQSGADREMLRYLTATGAEPGLSAQQAAALLRQRVKYVFVLYQENRSFDSYFGTFPGADGLYSKPADRTPGFYQDIVNTDGSLSRIRPFRIGPKDFAADTDDVDHSHAILAAKMNVVDGAAKMDRFAMAEEAKYAKGGKPSLMAKQFGELSMAYMDGDTVPFLWRYANRFVLFDHIFQSMVGPSTPGNLAIIAAQSGQTQAALHPDESYSGDGNKGPGEPVLNDSDPLWGSPKDPTTAGRQPVNPGDFPGYGVQLNQTYATLPLSLAGKEAEGQTSADRDASGDLGDIKDDIAFLSQNGKDAVPWGWFEEGYDKESTDSGADPTDAGGLHASYITHHNGPQYFGYIADNPTLSANLHGLQDFFDAVASGSLPAQGGVFFVKGGYKNIFGMKPADPDPAVQKNFLGDDDHPGYSDAQISEAMLAKAVNAIARSKYWGQCAIIVTWDDSEGDYDHVPPPIRSYGPDKSVVTDGPRVPLLVISPYARVHYIAHETGDHGSVVKFVDTLFALTPLAQLPDEQKGRKIGKQKLGQSDWGPDDAITSGVCDLLSAFDPARLKGRAAPLPASYAIIPDEIVNVLPQTSGYGCKDIGVTPVDLAANPPNPIPSDFNPRPRTTPTSASK
jgi:phospholipase C